MPHIFHVCRKHYKQIDFDTLAKVVYPVGDNSYCDVDGCIAQSCVDVVYKESTMFTALRNSTMRGVEDCEQNV